MILVFVFRQKAAFEIRFSDWSSDVCSSYLYRARRRAMMDRKRLLLIVEDDEAVVRTLKRSFERRDYEVRVAPSPDAIHALLAGWRPGYAVVDLKLVHASGLSCVQTLRAGDAAMRIVVLNGYELGRAHV